MSKIMLHNKDEYVEHYNIISAMYPQLRKYSVDGVDVCDYVVRLIVSDRTEQTAFVSDSMEDAIKYYNGLVIHLRYGMKPMKHNKNAWMFASAKRAYDRDCTVMQFAHRVNIDPGTALHWMIEVHLKYLENKL